MTNHINKTDIIKRLVALSLITTPLFAILGGTPFLRFDFKELQDFLPAIVFTAIMTIIFWVINIVLLLMAEKFAPVKNIFLRATLSAGLGLLVAAAGFKLYSPVMPRQPVRFVMEKPESVRIEHFQSPPEAGRFTFAPDSNLLTGKAPGQMRNKPPYFFFPMALRSLTINLIILTLCELVFLYYRKKKIESENMYLRQANLEARNNQLMTQLQPHFLFNSLNTLRLLLKKDTEKAEEYLLKLADMLRYSTTAAFQQVVPVSSELNMCIDYLEMQKVRFEGLLYFVISNQDVFSVSGNLPVFALQLLVENAIKHNALTMEEPLTIFIQYNKSNNTITIKNRIIPRRLAGESTGIGLANLEKRYKALCGKSIITETVNNEFSVTVYILPV